jgi:hypothetical protein
MSKNSTHSSNIGSNRIHIDNPNIAQLRIFKRQILFILFINKNILLIDIFENMFHVLSFVSKGLHFKNYNNN